MKRERKGYVPTWCRLHGLGIEPAPCPEGVARRVPKGIEVGKEDAAEPSAQCEPGEEGGRLLVGEVDVAVSGAHRADALLMVRLIGQV